MEYNYIFCIVIVFVAQFPSRSTISSRTSDQRAHRRHVDLTYAHYWETGLKEATYRTFLRKGYADPSLKDEIINAPLVGSNTDQATPFGDVAVLARGQLFYSAGGFLFVKDDRSYDCDECDEAPPLQHEDRGQIVALWTVKRLRHHDNTGYHRYETEYLISPVKDENYRKRNGGYNYDIPAYVFVLKNPQSEQSTFKNYLPHPPISDWYDTKGHPEYSPPPYNKVDRRYLPPLPPTSTDIPFYYAIPKTHHEYHKNTHYYDPDIIPARHNLEKEAELYKKFMESLRTTQSTTGYISESSMAQETSDGFEIYNRVTPIVSPPSTVMTSTFDFATTNFFPSLQTQNIRFPQTTPFRPSPMYTRYSEPDPLYTTSKPTTTERSIFYTKPINVISTTTTRSSFYPKAERTMPTIMEKSVTDTTKAQAISPSKSTFYQQPIKTTRKPTEKSTFHPLPVNVTKATTEKSIIYPETMKTTVIGTERSTSYLRPVETKILSMKTSTSSSLPVTSTKETTLRVGGSTSQDSVSLKNKNLYFEKSTSHPIKSPESIETTIITSTERSTFYDIDMSTTYSTPLKETENSIISPQPTMTTIISTEKSTSLNSTSSTEKPTSYLAPITTETSMVPPESIKARITTEKTIFSTQPVKSTSQFVDKSTFYSTHIVEKSSKSTTTPTEKSTVYKESTNTTNVGQIYSSKSTEMIKLTESPILWTTYVAESAETEPISKTTIKEHEPTNQSQHTSQSITTQRTTRRPELDFDIFNIFDKPKKAEEDHRLGQAEFEEKESLETIKTQMLSPEIIVRTTLGYVPTTQASTKKASPVTTTVQENAVNFQDVLKNLTSQDVTTDAITERYAAQSTNFVRNIVKNDSTGSEDVIPTISYDKISEMMLVESTNAYPSTIPASNEIATKELVTTNMINTEHVFGSTTIASKDMITSTTPISDEKVTKTGMTSIGKLPKKTNTTETVKGTESNHFSIDEDVDSFNKSTLSTHVTKKIAPKITPTVMAEPRFTSFSKRYMITTSLPILKTNSQSSTVYTTRRYKYTKIPKRKDYKLKKFDALATTKTSLSTGFYTTTEIIQIRKNNPESAKESSTANEALENTDNVTRDSTKDILNKQTLEVSTIKAKNLTEIDEPKIVIESSPSKVESEMGMIKNNITKEATLVSTAGNQLTEIPTSEAPISQDSESKISDSSTEDQIIPSSDIIMIEPSSEEGTSNMTEIITQNQLDVKWIKANSTQDGNLTTMTSQSMPSHLSLTTTSSKEIFEDLFGVYPKDTRPTTMALTTRKVNDSNRKLEEELFGVPDHSREDHSRTNETTTQIENTPKIIFDHFYEASTLPATTESIDFDSKEADMVTTSSPTTVMCNNLLTKLGTVNDNSNVIVDIVKALTENDHKSQADSQNDSASNEYDAKDTQLIEIIMVNMKENYGGNQSEDESDTIKANVTKIDVGDQNIQIYKAEVDEKDMSSNAKQEAETDLFERLALSVVNNAKGINYLTKKKSERKRRRKVIKQKIRRKEKQDTGS